MATERSGTPVRTGRRRVLDPTERFSEILHVRQAGVLILEKVAEETLLQRLAVIAVKMREVGIAVHLQPFLLRAGAQPTFEISARMQAHAAPIGGRQQGRLDLGEIGGARGVVIVVQPAALRFARRIGAMLGEFLFGQCLGSGDRLAGHQAFGAAVSDAMLHARHLARMPAVQKIAQDSAVAA